MIDRKQVIAQICDIIETTPLNEPDGHHLATKIYDGVFEGLTQKVLNLEIDKHTLEEILKVAYTKVMDKDGYTFWSRKSDIFKV